MSIFADSNVIVKAFTENKEKGACRKILFNDFVTTTLCLLEAQHAVSIIKNNRIYAANCIKSLFKSNGVIIRLDRNLLFESFKRIEKYELDIFDLVNYTAALLTNCSEFVSYDKDFDGMEIKRTEP